MKKIDITLITAYGKDCGTASISLSLLSMASYLNKHGFDARVIDRTKYRMPFPQMLKKIKNWNPRYVGIGAISSQANDALRLGKYLKKHMEIQLIYGGVHFTVLPEEGFLGGADIVVKGEGEKALLHILDKGIVGERICAGEPISDLDSIPLPKEGLIKSLNWNPDLFTMITSRGCPFNCLFCLDRRYREPGVRHHSVEYVLDFIELVKRTTGIRRFYIADEIFTLDQKWVFDFCEGIAKRKLDIELRCFTRCGINDFEMYRAMKQAGFDLVGLGIESANNNVLKAINKHQTIEECKRTIDVIRRAGLRAGATFMIGNITETETTIRETINFAKELCMNEGMVCYAQPFAGSRFRELAEEYGTLVNKDVKDYSFDKISFVPHGLTYSKMKKMRNEFSKTFLPKHKEPLLKRILDRINIYA